MAGKKDSLLQSAEKNLQKGRLEAALKDLLAALEDGGFDLNLLNRVGDLYVRLNRVEEAIPCFVRIAEHWVKDQRWPQATAIYKRINRLDPARLDVYEKLGELYAKQGLAADSRTHYQVLADHYLRQDNVAGAIGICQKMAAIDPGAVEVHVRLADLLVQSKRVPEAMKEYAAVAGLMRASGAAGQAAQVYAKALKIAPDNGEILRALVPLLVEQGAGEEARAAIRRALETTPRSVGLFLLAADTAVTLGDLAEARGFIAKAQAVEPENEDVVSAAVRIHLRSRRPELAFAAAQPLADAWLRRGEAKKAAGLLVPIVRGIPEHEEGLRKVAEVLSAAGEEKDAVPFRSALADVLRNTGRLAEAADILRVLSRSYPDVPEFRARLGQIEPLLPAAGPARATVGVPAEGPLSVAIPRVQLPAAEAAPEPAAPVAAEDEFEFVLEEAPPAEEASPAPPAGGESLAAAPPSFEFEIPDLERPARPGEASVASTFPVAPVQAPAPSPLPPPAAEEEVVEEIEELGALDQVHPSEELYTGAADAFEEPPTMAFEPPATIAFPRVPTVPAGTRVPWPGEKAGRSGPIGGPAAFDGPEVDEAIVEAEIFRKYGLVDKAIEQLRAAIKRYPASIRIREKVFEIYLEQGLRSEARREAESLHAAYVADGRTERARGLESLLGESLGPSPGAPPAAAIHPARGVDLSTLTPAPTPRAGGQKLRPLTADDIQIPMPLGPPAPARTRKVARTVPEIELPAELLALESSVRAHARIAPRAPEFPPTPIDQIEAMLPPAPPAQAVPAAPVAPSAPSPQAASFPGDDLARESFEAGFALPAPAPPEPVSDFISFPSLGADLLDEPILDEIEEARPAAPIEDVSSAAASAARPQPTLAVRALGAGPSSDDLSEIDFCLDQGMVVDAAERLQALDARFPGDPAVQQRRVRLEGTRVVAEDARPALDEIFAEDLDSVLDAELGRALTVEMAKGAAASDAAARPPDATRARTPVSLDESGLFSDEQEFFDFAEELQTELKETAAASPSAPELDGPSGAGSLEEIFREFKKGVEQQLSPEDFETHYNLGIAYKEMGLTDEAIGEFQVASKDPAHSVECCSMLGLCFLEKGLPQLAIKWYRKGLEAPNLRDEDRMGLQYDLAGVYLDVGDRDSAYKSYVDIYGIDANYRDVGEKLKVFAN